MAEFITQFHFLRPWWLLALLPALGFLWWNHLVRKHRGGVFALFAPHLLPHLLVNSTEHKQVRPHHIAPIFWVILIMAIAGPSWRQEPSPFAEDQAALVLVLQVTPSMTARDIQPSRLDRSVYKIADLLQLREGANTALVAYAGSAHQVMPLTRDSSIISTFARELSPEVMPLEGGAVDNALSLASTILQKSPGGGSILLLTDSIGTEHSPALKEYGRTTSDPVHILAAAAPPGTPFPAGSPEAPPLNEEELRQAAAILDGTLTLITADSSDVEEINRNIVRSHAVRQLEEEGSRWRDDGYLLLPLLCILSFFWCRRGWYLRWEGQG